MLFSQSTKLLFEAINSNDINSIKKLLENGIDINSTDKFGNTALILASESNNTEVVNFLILSGLMLITCLI